MTTGRPPIKTPDIIDVEATLDHPRIESALTMARYDAQAEQQEAMAEVFALGKVVGTALTAQTLGHFCAAAQIHAFAKINESKAFRHLPINMPDGTCAVAKNIDEFCKLVFGRGYRAMADHKSMMERLGEEAYENANRLGLNRAQLRLLIHLPEDTRTVVEEAMQAGSKSDVVTLIQSLANQLDETKAKAEELKADVAAKEERLAVKDKLINEAEDRAIGYHKLPPAEKLDAVLAKAGVHVNEALCVINGRFRQALLALVEIDQSAAGIKDFRPLAAGLAGQIQQSLTMLRDEFLLPDFVGDGKPEWMRATEHWEEV